MTKPTPVGPYDLIDRRKREVTPTPAQIEAAAAVLYRMQGGISGWSSAAEQVCSSFRIVAEAAITAAAEVGEPTTEQLQRHIETLEDKLDKYAELLATERERCAQVAERYAIHKFSFAKDIAAAIRAKEKP